MTYWTNERIEQAGLMLKEYDIPSYMHRGIMNWLKFGIKPGDFLQAVLENDLKTAAFMADSENKYKLANYIFWLHSYAPSSCWGSRDKVAQWKGLLQ